MREYQPERHLLNVLGFGHGNYSYINPQREWQQTTAFFGKVAGAHKSFLDGMRAEHITTFPSHLQVPDVARFEYFRKGTRPAGVFLVLPEGILLDLHLASGSPPSRAAYLPAPYGLSGFAP